MSQTANDQIANGLKQMLDGLNTTMKGLDGMVETAKKNMSHEEAIEFSKKMNESNLTETIKTAQSGIDDLKNTFNI